MATGTSTSGPGAAPSAKHRGDHVAAMRRISVVVPARNEEHTIGPLLQCLLAQTLPPAEIVIVDGGSTDATASVARKYTSQGVRLLEIGPAFPGAGRNRGIESAGAEWVALTDAGCTVQFDWLENLAAAAEAAPDARVVYGNYEPVIDSPWANAQAATVVAPIDPRTGCRPPSIASCLLNRDAWRAVGGFPEGLRAAEDLVFFGSVARSGIPVTRSPGAMMRWGLPATPGAFFRRLRLYSAHHLAAGLFGTWHLRVFAMDVAAVALGTGALAWPPLAGVLAMAFLARIIRTVAVRRGNVRGRLDPGALTRGAVLLVLADVATWLGAADYAASRLRQIRHASS